MNWRTQWFEYVKEVRRKQSKKQKKNLTHREAMNLASVSWPAQKLKIKKKLERAERKKIRLERTTAVPQKVDGSGTE